MKRAILLIMALLAATLSIGQTVFEGKWRKMIDTERDIIDGSIRASAQADIKAQQFFVHSSDAPGINSRYPIFAILK